MKAAFSIGCLGRNRCTYDLRVLLPADAVSPWRSLQVKYSSTLFSVLYLVYKVPKYSDLLRSTLLVLTLNYDSDGY